MARSFVSRIAGVAPNVSQVLSGIRPGLGVIYRSLSSRATYGNISYDMMENNSESIRRLKELVERSAMKCLDLKRPQAIKTVNYDLEISEADRFGKLIIGSESDVVIRYGDCGITPSSSAALKDLLKYELRIPSGNLGILTARHHTPFLIETSATDCVAIPTSSIEVVPEYDQKEIFSSVSMVKALELEEDLAKTLSIEVQRRIFSDRSREKFYKEVTSVNDFPTKQNTSSGTLMNFECIEIGKSNSTALHYHPGERRLHILTTNKSAGVVLNFCGIHEDPLQRMDCEVVLRFPPNSFLTLKFPAFTHHKFFGEFVCNSVHPKEGKNMLDLIESGKLPKGFLESATIFSQSDGGEKRVDELLKAPFETIKSRTL